MKYVYLIEKNAYDYKAIIKAFSSYQLANKYLNYLFEKLKRNGDYDIYQLINDSIIAYFEGSLIETIKIKQIEIIDDISNID